MIKDSVIVALQKAMQEQGYISRDAVAKIAEQFHISPTEVYATASFYQQFSFTPKGKHIISVCLGTACFIAGAQEILAMLEQELGIKEGEITADGKFSLERNVRCLGQCAAAPIVRIDDQVYEHATVSQIKEAINELR